MTKCITRAYNSIEVKETTILKSSLTERLRDEAEYYVGLNNQYPDLSSYFPRVIKTNTSSQEGVPSSIELEWFPYQNLGQLQSSQQSDWLLIATSLKHILEQMHSYMGDVDKFTYNTTQRRKMFFDKTWNEYQNLKTNFKWAGQVTNQTMVEVNSQPLLNFELCYKIIQPLLSKICIAKEQSRWTVIHGDLCFSNILCGFNVDRTKVGLKLIDPRGSFGEQGMFGDPIYDHAKLLHSLDGKYELIIQDNFLLATNDKDRIDFTFGKEALDSLCVASKVFEEVLFDKNPTYNLQSKVIEGLIFIGMCARHYDSESRQKVMYATGLRILNECITELGL